MTSTNLLPRHALALQRLIEYGTECIRERAARPAAEVDRFTIALSREAGTPALEVAREVGARLNWPVYDHEVPECIARELHLPVALVDQIDERRQNWLLECVAAFATTEHGLTQSRYLRRLIAIVRSLGEQGRGIVVGRGAAYILPPQTTLRVRLVGEREDRIAALGRRLHLDLRAAARKVEELNHERNRFVREFFHADPAGARHYDLVLNTSQWSPTDCADFIVQALHHKAAGRS